MKLAERLRQMDISLDRGLKSESDETIERKAIEDIVRHAFYAGIPPLTYLREKLANAPVVTVSKAEHTVQEFKCTHSECAGAAPFKNQMALNGHMKKHATSNPSIQS